MGVLTFIALIGLPLALGAHHHGATDAARDCATCVVAHCSPAEGAAPIALRTVLVSRPLPLSAAPAAIAACDRPAHPGRAPPTVLGDSAV